MVNRLKRVVQAARTPPTPHGLSLIEILLAVALLSIILLLAMNMTQEGKISGAIESSKLEMTGQARAVLEEVARELRRADPLTVQITEVAGGQRVAFRTITGIDTDTGQPVVSPMITYGPVPDAGGYAVTRTVGEITAKIAVNATAFEVSRSASEIHIRLALQRSVHGHPDLVRHEVSSSVTLRNR